MRNIVALVFVAFASTAFTQVRFTVYSGLNAPVGNLFRDKADPLALYWKNGIVLGASGEFGLGKRLSVIAGIEYNRYEFHSYPIQNYFFSDFTTDQVTGTSSSCYRGSLLIRGMAKQGQVVEAYAATGVAYVIEKPGTITEHVMYRNVVAYQIPRKWNDRYYFTHVFGFGLLVHPLENFGIDVSGRYFSNYTDRMHITWALGLYVQLPQSNEG